MSGGIADWNQKEQFERFAKKIAFSSIGHEFNYRHPPHPEFLDTVSAATQVKLADVTALMLMIGGAPNDTEPLQVPIRKFNVLEPEHISFLARPNFHPERPRAIFFGDYVNLFQGNKYLLHPERTELFYNHLIHCLLVDVELVVVIHYFSELGLARQSIPLSLFAPVYDGDISDLALAQLGTVSYPELYGRPFVDLMAIMIRAQWDKLTRLLDIAFKLPNWDSINDGLAALRDFAATQSEGSSHLIGLYADTAKSRLDENRGWLRPFRDGLLHKTGQHSRGVAPQRKSVDTTTDLWNKCLDEYDYLREAFFVALIAIVMVGFEKRESVEN